MGFHSRSLSVCGRFAAAIILSAAAGACGSSAPNEPPPPTTQPPATTPPTTLPAPPRLGSLSCDRIGEGKNQERCSKESPSFFAEVDRSIDEIVHEQPHIFNLSESIGSGSYKVKSTGQFLVAMIDKMDKKNLCAAFDGEELQVKNSNAFNDQYHLITSNGYLRRGDSSYRATCYPATFPMFQPLPGQVAGCSLPPSREITCGREEENIRFLHVVDAAIDKVGQTHPEVFDKNNVQAGTNWWKIVDHDKYVVHMIEALKPSGLCAFFDGEELQVKNSNKSAELFDITTAASYVRRGEGSYRSTCYPASF
jgi:hypothetical protein